MVILVALRVYGARREAQCCNIGLNEGSSLQGPWACKLVRASDRFEGILGGPLGSIARRKAGPSGSVFCFHAFQVSPGGRIAGIIFLSYSEILLTSVS
jgi:hypothetical protein